MATEQGLESILDRFRYEARSESSRLRRKARAMDLLANGGVDNAA
jgi:hypothetical protein